MRRILLLLPLLLVPCLAQTQPATAKKAIDLYALSADDFFKRSELQARISKESADVSLLEAAIFHAANRERAQQKLAPFKHSWALNLMARRHSQEMSDLQFFDHVSPTPQNRTLSERLKNVGLVNVTAGENIAVLPAMQMGSGSYLVTTNADGSKVMTDEKTGKIIDYYSYEELATAVLTNWMNSPPHRANILDKRFLYLGAGVARGSYDKGQDSFYMTQNFSGSVNAGEVKAARDLVPAKGK